MTGSLAVFPTCDGTHSLSYKWHAGDAEHELRLVPIAGTSETPFMFGAKPNQRPIEVPDFHMMSTPVTQALWVQVMGSNPSELDEPEHPVDHVSWDDITKAGGFLERINSSEVRSGVAGSNRSLRFRLPSEAEWEYAARGGPHWLDGYAFSGSNDIDSVAWYAYKFGPVRRLTLRLLGWTAGWRLANRFKRPRQTRTHPVAAKKPNQLGLYDMSGNVWEWCQDVCVNDIDKVPNDGTPWLGPGSDRRLRGGCHHNWDIHCTVWFRYGIVRDAYDGCIGFRLVLAPD